MDEYMNNDVSVLIQGIKAIIDMDEAQVADAMPVIQDQVSVNFPPELEEQSVNQLVNNLEDQRLNREEAYAALNAAKEGLKELIGFDTLSETKQEAANLLLMPLFRTFDKALEKFHLYHIELPLTLEEGAQIPTYAHDTDACADLYALENTVVRAGTYGNKIRTGVKIQLPEGWMAMIFPRSSTGAKTPLRLSNSVGIIDSSYRGELGILFDNFSGHDYEIKAGDRVAQMMVMPSYRFMPQVVESLEDSDRGEGGFGSTGT